MTANSGVTARAARRRPASRSTNALERSCDRRGTPAARRGSAAARRPAGCGCAGRPRRSAPAPAPGRCRCPPAASRGGAAAEAVSSADPVTATVSADTAVGGVEDAAERTDHRHVVEVLRHRQRCSELPGCRRRPPGTRRRARAQLVDQFDHVRGVADDQDPARPAAALGARAVQPLAGDVAPRRQQAGAGHERDGRGSPGRLPTSAM